MDKILVTKFYFSNIDMVSSMASNPLKYFYTLSKILLDEKHVPRPPLFLETKQNSQLHYRSDKNHNDSKLCQKVIILKVSEKILYIKYSLVMFKFWKFWKVPLPHSLGTP